MQSTSNSEVDGLQQQNTTLAATPVSLVPEAKIHTEDWKIVAGSDRSQFLLRHHLNTAACLSTVADHARHLMTTVYPSSDGRF